jgi:hypothetical protein
MALPYKQNMPAEGEGLLLETYNSIGPVYALVMLGGGILLSFVAGMGCSYCFCMRRHVEVREKGEAGVTTTMAARQLHVENWR